jgi:putative nucleotidyltransferase with HDIG domain
VGKTGANSGHLLGVLMLGEARDESREPISQRKLSLIGGIGDQAASAIRRMLLSQETDRRLQHLTALSEIDRAITSGFDLKASLKTILNQVRIQLGVDAANVLLLNPSSHILEFISGQGFHTKTTKITTLRLGESYAGRAALEQIIFQVSNPSDDTEKLLTTKLARENFVSYFGVPLIAKGKVKGVLEIFNRTPLKPNGEWLDFLKALAEQAAIAIDNAMLFEGLTRSNFELALAYDDTIEGWSRALDLRDKETEGHSLRVTEKTLELARSFGMNQDELVQIRWGALLHDIGKMGIPDGILLKPGPLTVEEWVLMKKHPTMAYELLSPIHYLRLALDIPYCHHEKWDGTGYPRGLKGEQIPLAARIFAIIDVWDALRSDRPYRPAWSKEKTIKHIQLGSGTHFDPQVVKTFFLDIDINAPT